MERFLAIVFILALALMFIALQGRSSEGYELGYAFRPQKQAYACITQASAANVAKALVDYGERGAAIMASIQKVSGLCETILTFTPVKIVREVERKKDRWVSLVIATPSPDWLTNEVFVIFAGKYEPGVET